MQEPQVAATPIPKMHMQMQPTPIAMQQPTPAKMQPPVIAGMQPQPIPKMQARTPITAQPFGKMQPTPVSAQRPAPAYPRLATPVSALNQFSMLPAQNVQQPVVATTPRKTLKNLAYHLRDQARIIQLNQPESLEQYRSLGILFDLVDLCEQASSIDRKQHANPADALQKLFWRAVETLKACPLDSLSPFRSYGLRLEHTIQSMWAAYAKRAPLRESSSAFAVPEIRLLPVGAQVEYYSNTYRRWMEATVLDHILPEGDYQLDIQGHAKKENVRAALPRRPRTQQLTDGNPEAPSQQSHGGLRKMVTKETPSPISAQDPSGQQAGSGSRLNTPAGGASAVSATSGSASGRRPDCDYPPGTIVEYWSASLSQWILAEVFSYNTVNRTYNLDCKSNAPRERIRPHQSARSQQEPPLNDNTRPVLQRFDSRGGRKISASSPPSGGRLEEAPGSPTKEVREGEARSPPPEMKTHHDMATGKIVKTQVGPDGNETQLVFDYHNQPGMRRSAVMREQTADFIRNSGKQRGGPPQMTVQVVTQDGRPHYDEDNPYMQRVMQWEGDAQKVRQMTQQKVHDLTKKAQLLVQKFENDVEKDTDMKQYEIPKLSVVAAPLGPESGWHQSRSSTSRPSQNPYMREYYDERAMDNSVSKFSDEQTVASGQRMNGTRTSGARAGGLAPPPAVTGANRRSGAAAVGAKRRGGKTKAASAYPDSNPSSCSSDDGGSGGRKGATSVAKRPPPGGKANAKSRTAALVDSSSDSDNVTTLNSALNRGGPAWRRRAAANAKSDSSDGMPTFGRKKGATVASSEDEEEQTKGGKKLPPWKARSSPAYEDESGTSLKGKKAPAARGKPASRMKESGENADEQNENSDAYSDADTTLTKGTRGQCAWDFVPLPAARDSTTSTQEQNNEKKAPSARPSANFGRARRSFNTRGGGSPDQLRSTRGDEDGSASPAKALRGKPKRATNPATNIRASGLIPSKKQSYSPAKQTSDSPSKRKQDSEDDTPTARWTPWGGPFGLGRFGTFDDDDN